MVSIFNISASIWIENHFARRTGRRHSFGDGGEAASVIAIAGPLLICALVCQPLSIVALAQFFGNNRTPNAG
jgi:hypothetical protein